MEWMVRTELRLLQLLFANILQGAENSPQKASFSATFSQVQGLGRLSLGIAGVRENEECTAERSYW
jgi:hypothetical protein